MPVSAPFEVPERVCVCVCVCVCVRARACVCVSEQRARRGAEERANSLGKAVECPASSRCFTHMHLKGISISGSALSQQLRGVLGVFFLLNQQHFAERDYMALSGRIQQTFFIILLSSTKF